MIKVKKIDERAVLPTKAHPSDIGYDLTVFEKHKEYGNVTLFRTGLKFQCPPGYYLEIFPRSSISKSGYAFAHSVGVLDPHYRGEVFVPLRKIDKDAAAELPWRVGQIVLRRVHELSMQEVEELDDETDRGEGGFGSTG